MQFCICGGVSSGGILEVGSWEGRRRLVGEKREGKEGWRSKGRASVLGKTAEVLCV